MSPSGRTLVYLRDAGYLAATVEKWIPQTQRRSDLFGCIDIIALHPVQQDRLLIQATSASNCAARVAKLRRSAELLLALRSGMRAEVWAWEQRGGRWTPRRVEILADDLAGRELTVRRRRGRRPQQTELFETPA